MTTDPSTIRIDVRNTRAYVARRQGADSSFSYEPCANWRWLEALAVEAVEAQGGSVTLSALYDCPDALAALALWAEDVLGMVTTPQDAERALGVGDGTVLKAARDGRIHALPRGGVWLVFEPETRARWGGRE